MANFNLNKVILGGRLTADPELKQTPSGVSVCTFGIAVNRRFTSKDASAQTQADFFNVTAWRATAEFVSKYFRKGSSICVVGSLQNRTWTDQQGAKHYATDIVADEVNFVDSRNETASSAPYTNDAYSAPSFSSDASVAPKFEELKTDDDLPF
jgi:single-strand DNA-binding protein